MLLVEGPFRLLKFNYQTYSFMVRIAHLKVLHTDCKLPRGGGVALYVNMSIAAHTLDTYTNENGFGGSLLMLAKLSNNGYVVIGMIYLSPSAAPQGLTDPRFVQQLMDTA